MIITNDSSISDRRIARAFIIRAIMMHSRSGDFSFTYADCVITNYTLINNDFVTLIIIITLMDIVFSKLEYFVTDRLRDLF